MTLVWHTAGCVRYTMAEEFYRAPLNSYPVSYVRGKKLLYALYKGDVRELRKFIPTVYNPNQRFYATPDNTSSATNLGALAIVNNKPEVLRLLVHAGLSTGVTNGKNMNLFSEAASVKYVSHEIVDMLFVPDNDGDFLNDQPFEAGYNTAAHLAVIHNNSYLLDRLLRMGKSVLVATLRNATGNTALTMAIKLSEKNGGSMAMRLARYVEEVTKESWSSVVDDSGYNALELAEANQLYDVVKILTAPRRPDECASCSLNRRIMHDEDDEYIDEEGSMVYEDEFSSGAGPTSSRQAEVARYEQIISDIEKQYAVREETAEERYARGLVRIKHEADIEVDKLSAEVARLTAALNEARVKTAYSTTFLDADEEELGRVMALLEDQSRINEALQKQIAAMHAEEDADKREALEGLRARMAKKMDTREAYFTREKEVRDNTIESLKNELATAEDQVIIMNNSNTKALATLKAEYEEMTSRRDAELEEELSMNNQQHASEMARMRAEHTQAISDLLSVHDLGKRQTEARYEEDIRALDECRAEISRMRAAFAIDLEGDDEKKKLLHKIKKNLPLPGRGWVPC